MADIHELSAQTNTRFSHLIERSVLACGELTLVLRAEHLLEVAKALCDEPAFDFKLLVDVCGVDYLHYGISEWETESASGTGFERGVIEDTNVKHTGKRFASVYHL